MLLPDHEIRKRCLNPMFFSEGKPLLSPFSEGVQGDGIISYGLTHAGYDLRMAEEVWVFKNTKGIAIDPKRFKGDPEEVKKYQEDLFDVYTTDMPVKIPAHGYLLVRSIEYIWMPKDLAGTCVGKSTLARCGVIINTTPIEAGWHGYLTIEVSNPTASTQILYPHEGIAQITFQMLFGIPEKCYGDKSGKYQGQMGVTPARIL